MYPRTTLFMTSFMLALLSALFMSLSAHAQNCTVIDFWTTETQPTRLATIRYLAQAFNACNPDARVNVTALEENAVRHLNNIADQEVKPDLLGCSSAMVMSMAHKGQMDMSATDEIIHEIGEKHFSKGILHRLANDRGEYCGIPLCGWVQGIWYRKDWFEKAGLEPPDTPKRILAAARALHDPARNRYGILIGSREDVYAEQVFTHLALANGVSEYSPDGDVVFDSPNTVKTLQLYRELNNYAPPGQQYWRGRDFYLQGRLAMMFYSTFIMDDLALPSSAANSLTPDNFPQLEGAPFDTELLENSGMIPVITGTRPASFGIIHALGIIRNRNMAKRKAVKQFVRFLYRQDAYITWLHMAPGGMLPVLRDVADSDDFYRDAQGVFRRYSHRKIRQIVKGLGSIDSFGFKDGTIIPKAAEVSAQGIIPSMIMRTLSGEFSPEQAVSWAAGCMRELQWSDATSVH